jgi:DNA-binding NtrC family response regulator
MSENQNYTILIAEDNDITRELMTKIMSSEGYKVLEAVDGSTAKDVVKKNEVSLALVDLHMAPEGGFDFAKFVANNNLNIPVVLVTGDQGMDLLLETRKYNIAQMIQKPVEPDRLKSTVSRVLKKYYG